MTVKKTTVECYQLRNIGDVSWADFYIDTTNSEKKSGRLLIASDWGSWQNYWGHCGIPFKQFLIGLAKSPHYAANKLGDKEDFVLEKTVREIKNRILSYRKGEFIDGLYARNLWNEVLNIEGECLSEAHYDMLFYNSEHLNHFYDELPKVKEMSKRFQDFWQKAFLPFIEILKTELETRGMPPQ